MSYSDLVHAYFERSTALQWYWTLYVIVIGGVLGFSTFRQRPELVTTVLVTILYGCFAYKNLGAIEATAEERQAILSAVKAYPESGSNANDIKLARSALDSVMPTYDIAGARYFHVACDLLTVVFLWAKEWRRRRPELAAK
jgi:TctA family transporter